MSLFYTMAYWLGFAPWEHTATHPPAARHIIGLFEREERGRESPYGRALDLGCGRGHWSVTLAQRGWDVTGVELVPKAMRAARAHASDAGVKVQVVQGDVTILREAGVGSGFRLVWDFGTVHGLTDAQRRAVGEGVSALATDDAAILMLAWGPGRKRSATAGVKPTRPRGGIRRMESDRRGAFRRYWPSAAAAERRPTRLSLTLGLVRASLTLCWANVCGTITRMP